MEETERTEGGTEASQTPAEVTAEAAPARRHRLGWPEWMSEFDSFFAPLRFGDVFARFPDVFEGRGVPAMRIEELTEDDHMVVRAELPGVDPAKDVDISIDHGRLRIRAERRERSETEDEGRTRSEFRYGSFERTVPLPPGATEDDVKATYRDGILEVRVPVDGEKAEARRIPIERG